jgi:hypothetical protein
VHAHDETCVRSITEEVLDRMMCIGEACLRYAMRCSVPHYHAERHHQGLGHALSTREPEVGRITGRIERRKHLGDLLSYDDREAA